MALKRLSAKTLQKKYLKASGLLGQVIKLTEVGIGRFTTAGGG